MTKGKRKEEFSAVDHPAHYTQGDIEVIDYIDQVADAYQGVEAYYVGNILKYVSRSPHKNGIEDLRKAAWYLDRLIRIQDEKSTGEGE